MNNAVRSPYLQRLQGNSAHFQHALEILLERYQVQPVGNGYIDLIIKRDDSLRFLRELTVLPLAVCRVTWWCHCTPANASQLGCPHGYGGPIDKYDEGWFSECVQYPDFDLVDLPDTPDERLLTPEAFSETCNSLVAYYIRNILPTEHFYSSCLYAGLWLSVPDDWNRPIRDEPRLP